MLQPWVYLAFRCLRDSDKIPNRGAWHQRWCYLDSFSSWCVYQCPKIKKLYHRKRCFQCVVLKSVRTFYRLAVKIARGFLVLDLVAKMLEIHWGCGLDCESSAAAQIIGNTGAWEPRANINGLWGKGASFYPRTQPIPTALLLQFYHQRQSTRLAPTLLQ